MGKYPWSDIQDQRREERRPQKTVVVKPVKYLSPKREKQQREYIQIVEEMLKENPYCEIKEEGCQKIATGLHHQKKRTPATITDKRYLIRACNACQMWCELNPLEAIVKGHSVSKHIKEVV